jgi:hypothetical protein
MALLLVLIGMLLPAAAASSLLGPCRDRIVRDYEEPLRHMPANRPPPEGTLPFGPKDLSIHGLTPQRVVLQGAAFGYQFSSSRGTTELGQLKPAFDLHWEVATTLLTVNRRGRTIRAIVRRNQHFGKVRRLRHLAFTVTTKPGLYRFDLSFRKHDGPRLGFYSEYFRVVPRRVDFRVAISQSVVHVGETALGRFENLGTELLTLPKDEGLAVEREEDGQWLEVPSAEPGVIVLRAPAFVYGGHATRCSSFEISPETPTGPYRFSAQVEVAGVRSRISTAQFSVEP